MDLPEIYKDPDKPGMATGQQRQALDLFLNYHTLAQISQAVDVALGTARDWVYVGRNGMLPFSEIRGGLEKEMLREIAGHKGPALKSIMDSSLCVIRSSLESIKKSGRNLEINEIKEVSNIIANMDKILRLDEGKATDNIAIANVNMMETVADLKEAIYEVDMLDILGLHEEE